jgi:hypothetical protein
MRRPLALICIVAALAASGCGSQGRWEAPYINFPSFSSEGANYSQMAREIARDLDAQIVPRMGISGNRNAYYVAVTVPSNLHALENSSALSRVMAQEIASALSEIGYNVQEMRKSRDIVFDRAKGELYLTRNVNALARRDVSATLVVAGTYSAAPGGTRFSVECLDARNNNVVAMAARTVSAAPDQDTLFGGVAPGNGLTPSVVTTQGINRKNYYLP